MKIGIPTETRRGETRVAATPETVRKLAAKHQVMVQSGAGLHACVPDAAYAGAGATIGSAADALGAGLVLKVRAPDADERALMKPGAVLVGMLNPFDAENIEGMAQSRISAFTNVFPGETFLQQVMLACDVRADRYGILRSCWPTRTGTAIRQWSARHYRPSNDDRTIPGLA